MAFIRNKSNFRS